MKRLICCLDGTWNDNRAGSVLTNVAKLAKAVAAEDGKGVRQVTHYVDGIASAQGMSWQFLKGALGFEVSARIREGYELLAESYGAGDELYLFGFSRGAFEARSLAGFIALFGIKRHDGDFSFERAWALYRKPAAKRNKAALAALRAASHYPAAIKCIGVWDTVGNIGNPFFSSGWLARRFKFHDTRLPETVDVALHALAIDEVRGPFRPTLWTLPEGAVPPAHQHIEQVWFAGSHADVGGGFREAALSDVPLVWMANRTGELTGLAFDPAAQARWRPDPLGPQHASATGRIFKWSAVIPFIRLVRQRLEAIPPLRRTLLGSWRTGKLRAGEMVVNESIDGSVAQRHGQLVIEHRDDVVRMMRYAPPNLMADLLPAGTPATPAANQPGKLRRAKVYTVHGTFDHLAPWDNWDDRDEEKKRDLETKAVPRGFFGHLLDLLKGSEPNVRKPGRHFINRLSEHLLAHEVILEKADHTQYEWSSGNSHDERRIAAIGLKKLIEDDLTRVRKEHGEGYYNGGVYVIGHSHGGTVARLAMNLWDKDSDYYGPDRHDTTDELKHDDECPVCRRQRNGTIGPNTVPRPNRVFTFGSPFVTFEQRRGSSLITAKLGIWVFRVLALVPLLAAYVYMGYMSSGSDGGANKAALQDSVVQSSLRLMFPLLAYWLLAGLLPQRVLQLVERWFGLGLVHLIAKGAVRLIRLVGKVSVCIFYVVFTAAAWDGGSTAGWNAAAQWFRVLATYDIDNWLLWGSPAVIFWLLAITLPGRMLRWLDENVGKLRGKLPKKYDPLEDKPVPYVSYLAPGDEAGLHLRIFGVITWIIQTLSLAAACVLAVGFFLVVFVGIEHLMFLAPGKRTLLSYFGLSAWSGIPEQQDRFIALMDSLTRYPARIWSLLGGNVETKLLLGDLPNKYEVVAQIPAALVHSVARITFLTMPLVLLALMTVYFISIRLRGSGMVFGSERFTWTLANRISVTRRANGNTMVRNPFITPEAWKMGELTHCYYYKSDLVTKDVADLIADPSRHTPDRPLPIMSWLSATARWLVVLLYVLGIFVVAVPRAEKMEKDRIIAAENEKAAKEKAEKTKAEAAAAGTPAPAPVPTGGAGTRPAAPAAGSR